MRQQELLLTLVLLTLGSSCRGVQPTRTSFLSDHDQLADVGEGKARRRYLRADVDWSRYDSVWLAPLEFHLVPASESLSDGRRASLTTHMDAALRSALEGQYVVLDVPRNGTFKVRAAVTDVDRTSFTLNGLLALLVLPLDPGGATVELELVDATSGERLGALVNAYRGGVWNMTAGMNPIGHAAQALDAAAAWVGEVTGAGAVLE